MLVDGVQGGASVSFVAPLTRERAERFTDGDAARLYARLGWARVGDIPNDALMPDGRPCGTTYFCRDLAS